MSVTITDLTRMWAGRICIAGYAQNGHCIRPVTADGLYENWLYDDKKPIILPFSIVEFDLHKSTPQPPHTEDWEIEPTYRARRALITGDHRKRLLLNTHFETVQDIFETPIMQGPGWYVKIGEGKRSLGTIRPKWIFQAQFGRDPDTELPRIRIAFKDWAEQRYNLNVNDLTLLYYLNHLCATGCSVDEAGEQLTQVLQKSETYLRVGLARGDWVKFPNRCHLQVTGVYTFPDYLNGKCFADFATTDL